MRISDAYTCKHFSCCKLAFFFQIRRLGIDGSVSLLSFVLSYIIITAGLVLDEGTITARLLRVPKVILRVKLVDSVVL